MTASKMSTEQGSMEDTWVGKLMFPAGICKDSVYVPKQALIEKTQEKILDTPAVYLLASGYFHIYWCQELTAVILRMGSLASQSGFSKALHSAVEASMDNSVTALVLDFRENQLLRYPMSTEELGLEDFGRYVAAVHPAYGQQGLHDHVHLYGFDSMQKAADWLRPRKKSTTRAGDIIELVKGNKNIKLVEANYAGSAYWSIPSRTLIVSYSGHAEESKGTAELWVEVSSFLEHLRAQALIIDIRHMVKMHTALTQEISTAIEYLVSRGARRFILVGARRVKPCVNDAAEAYFEILSHAPGGALTAKTLQQALQLAINPQQIRALNS